MVILEFGRPDHFHADQIAIIQFYKQRFKCESFLSIFADLISALIDYSNEKRIAEIKKYSLLFHEIMNRCLCGLNCHRESSLKIIQDFIDIQFNSCIVEQEDEQPILSMISNLALKFALIRFLDDDYENSKDRMYDNYYRKKYFKILAEIYPILLLIGKFVFNFIKQEEFLLPLTSCYIKSEYTQLQVSTNSTTPIIA
ncbi:MAG: hypothetical protein ACXAC7_12085 [Candidatus Hodarchaeales archaeon]|jgi:hypothetical protein